MLCVYSDNAEGDRRQHYHYSQLHIHTLHYLLGLHMHPRHNTPRWFIVVIHMLMTWGLLEHVDLWPLTCGP